MKRIGLLTAFTFLLVLGLVAVAHAASPQDIYNDYAAHGTLTGTYTAAELQAYLDDATIDEYGNPTVTKPLDALVGRVLGIMKAKTGISFADALKQALGQSTAENRGTFPFTGFDAVAVLLGSILLVGSGLALRRATR
jgi:hypothetical protein